MIKSYDGNQLIKFWGSLSLAYIIFVMEKVQHRNNLDMKMEAKRHTMHNEVQTDEVLQSCVWVAEDHDGALESK